MRIVETAELRHIYTHILPDGTNLNIDSTALHTACAAFRPPLHTVPIDASVARSFVTDNIVDLERVKTLTARFPRLSPVIFCVDNEPAENEAFEGFLVDGHHRYVMAYQMHLKALPAYILPEHTWKYFVLKNVPSMTREELLASPVTKRAY